PSSLKPDKRINAINVPNIKAPATARPVNVSVNVMPSKNRYPSERRMTSKSKFENIGGSPPANVAGHRHRALQEAHQDDNHHINQEVKQGRRGEGLENLKRNLLHGAPLAGELNPAHGD